MSIADTIYGPVKILAIVMTFFICVFIWTSFTGVFSDITENIDPAYQAQLNDSISTIGTGINTIDYMMPLIVVGLLIISLVFAFKTGASVIYSVLSIIMWVFALIMSAIFTNTYEQFDATLNLGSTYVISDFLMTNMKWIVLGWLILITIIMFTKTKAESNTERFSASETVFGGA